ncbi:MAG: Gfo/Idh/MocA family protein [Muribaculaceae bacterium]
MEKERKIRVVLVGAGYRGMRLLELMEATRCYHVTAVYDPALQHPEVPNSPHLPSNIAVYCHGDDDYRRMLSEQKPQLVVIASPWHCHIPQATIAVQAGCHIALEIRGGMHRGEYDSLISLANSRNLCIFPLENTIFMRENMAMLQMVQQGVFGELVALRGGYRHDLRDMLIAPDGSLGNPMKPEGAWRSKFYTSQNGDLYPTHGLAPLCLAAGIGKHDRMARLTAFASKARGLQNYIERYGGTPVTITQADIVITQIETQGGVLISLTHDTTLPRPRSLDFEVQGTKGIWRGELRKIYIEGKSPFETWEDDEPYIEAYEHPFWQQWGEEALSADRHHQGMDYIMLRALAAHLNGSAYYPATARDLALWTQVSPLSKLSIAQHRTIEL